MFNRSIFCFCFCFFTLLTSKFSFKVSFWNSDGHDHFLTFDIPMSIHKKIKNTNTRKHVPQYYMTFISIVQSLCRTCSVQGTSLYS